MSRFFVNFYNGISARTYKATLTASAFEWKIEYVDESQQTITQSWTIEDIQKSTVYTKGWVTFTYGVEFPFQKIETDNADFINYIKTSVHENLRSGADVFLHKSSKKSLIALILLFFGIGIGMYFYVIPQVAAGFATSLSNKNVIAFGDYVFRVISSELEIDEKKSEKLQDFVDALEIHSSFQMKVYVAKSELSNAFAVSGGKFVIFSGLLEKMNRKEQLVALIGHEISHIENRHPLKSVARNMSGAIFLSVLFSDVNSVTAILADNAHLFSQLSYSRKLEKEADLVGLELMRNNHLDLDGMPELFALLQTESMIDVPAYLSSHPMLKDRIEYTQAIADAQEPIIENTVLQQKWDALQLLLNIDREAKKAKEEEAKRMAEENKETSNEEIETPSETIDNE